jgi:hypothetical protein
MAFLRHVGKIGDRKVAIVFREVPGEPHMCLVVFTEILNQHIHDPLMKCIESDIGQHSQSLADALNRSYHTDGRIILQVLHAEHQLKKVQTSQVVMTPAPNAFIRLDELNKILNEMDQGEAAVKRLSELDKSAGLQDPIDVARRMRGNNSTAPVVPSTDLLGDNAIANDLRQQADRMNREAKGLMAEADRLLKEASSLDPVVPEVTAPIAESKVRKQKTKKVNVA